MRLLSSLRQFTRSVRKVRIHRRRLEAPLKSFLERAKRALLHERAHEQAQLADLFATRSPGELEAAYGVTVRNLNIVSERTGLFSKRILTLSKKGIRGINQKSFAPGVPVRVTWGFGGMSARGEEEEEEEDGDDDDDDEEEKRTSAKATIVSVVLSSEEGSGAESEETDYIEIAISGGMPPGLSRNRGSVHLELVADETSYKRIDEAMSNPRLLNSRWIHMLYHPESFPLFEIDKPSPPTKSRPDKSVSRDEDALNDIQREVVETALATKSPIYQINGPPGTGKTTVLLSIIERVLSMRKRGEGRPRVLVVAPSNVAVDNLLLRMRDVLPSGGATTDGVETGKSATAKKKKKKTTREDETGEVAKDVDASRGRGRSRSRSRSPDSTLGAETRRLRLLRLGHPARVHPDILNRTLDHFVEHSQDFVVVREAREELETALAALAAPSGGKRVGEKRERGGGDDAREDRRKQRRARRAEVGRLRKEIKQREKKIARGAVREADVVFATVIGCHQMKKFYEEDAEGVFDWVIVDEAAQGMEPSIFVPMQFLKPQTGRLVLAGDHLQLGPTIKSPEATKSNLGWTMMDRVAARFGDDPAVVGKLRVQYRMNEAIMAWSSRNVYGDTLIADVSCATRTLDSALAHRPDPSVVDMDLLRPLVFLDTNARERGETFREVSAATEEEEGAGDDKQSAAITASKSNLGEAAVVAAHVRYLLSLGLNPADLAVITPYSAQVVAIDRALSTVLGEAGAHGVEVRTVDGFQGREKEVVIISAVRSNERGGVGFLSDPRRMNVAVTRAKRQVVLIGDAETLVRGDPFLKAMVDHFRERGEVRDAEETVAEIDGEDVMLGLDGGAGEMRTASGGNVKEAKKTTTTKKKKKKKETVATTKKSPTIATKTTSQNETLPLPVERNGAGLSEAKVKRSGKTKKEKNETREALAEEKIQVDFSKLNLNEEDEEEEEANVHESEKDASNVNAEVVDSTVPERETISTSAKTKKKKMMKTTTTSNKDDDDDDDDAFLDALIASQGKCAWSQGCTADVKLIGHDCPYCRSRYCLKHRHPEIHGCGGEARIAAVAVHANVRNTGAMDERERAKIKSRIHAAADREARDKTMTKKKTKG